MLNESLVSNKIGLLKFCLNEVKKKEGLCGKASLLRYIKYKQQKGMFRFYQIRPLKTSDQYRFCVIFKETAPILPAKLLQRFYVLYQIQCKIEPELGKFCTNVEKKKHQTFPFRSFGHSVVKLTIEVQCIMRIFDEIFSLSRLVADHT